MPSVPADFLGLGSGRKLVTMSKGYRFEHLTTGAVIGAGDTTGGDIATGGGLGNMGVGNIRWTSALCKFAREARRHRFGSFAIVTLRRDPSEAPRCLESGSVYLVGTDGFCLFALPITSGYDDLAGFEAFPFDASFLRSGDTLEVRTNDDGTGFAVQVRSKRGERSPLPLGAVGRFPTKESLLKIDTGIPAISAIGGLNPEKLGRLVDVLSAHLEDDSKRLRLYADSLNSPVFTVMRSGKLRACGVIMPIGGES